MCTHGYTYFLFLKIITNTKQIAIPVSANPTSMFCKTMTGVVKVIMSATGVPSGGTPSVHVYQLNVIKIQILMCCVIMHTYLATW